MPHRCSKPLRGRVLPGLLFLVLASPLPADEPGAGGSSGDNDSAFYETATVRARPVDRATAAVTILDRETIESLGVVSAAELLRFVPGVDVASTGPRAGSATAQIRGGDPNYTQVLVDGVPINDITDQVGGAVNLNSLSTAHIERVEIVRGPLSSSMGSTGLAGAINIITRRGKTESPELSFDLAAGDDSVVVGSAGISRGDEHRDYFLGVTWEEQEDSIDYPGARDDFEEWSVSGNARFDLGSHADLRVTGRIASWETSDYPETSGGPILGSGELRHSDNDEVSLGLEANIGREGHRHKVRATAYRHDLERQSPTIVDPGVVPATDEDTTYTTWELRWAAPQVDFAHGGRLDFGADVRVDDGESDEALLGLSYRIDRTTPGAFVEYVLDRGRTQLELAARVDDPEDFDTEVSPRLGVAVGLGAEQKTRLRASVGRAFKLPSFFALAVPFFGNPELRPETVLGVDAAVEHAFSEAGLRLVLTLFYNRFEDLVDFSDDAFTFVNVPRVESRGAELALAWQACERLRFAGNVTRETFDDQPADPLTHRPEWVGAAQVAWDVAPRARWSLDGQWVSEAYDFQVPLLFQPPFVGTQLTAGYQLYGTAVEVDLARGWSLHARVDNLADKEYEPYIGFPGPDRSFRIGVRYGARR